MMCAPIVLAARSDVAGQVMLQLDVPPTLPCFVGHFPGFPVVPGVVQLDWAMQLGITHLRCGQPSATDFRVKFKRIIRPGAAVTLTLRHDAARRRLDFAYRVGEDIASQGRVALASS